MATWLDVRRIALAFPETTESEKRGAASWVVRKKAFAWERPLRKTDIAQLGALGEPVPGGEIMAVKIDHVESRAAMIAEAPHVLFTVPHFANYPAVLVRLDAASIEELEELLEDAWVLCAPQRLAAAHLAERDAH
jgi:hypothetical protein